MGAEVEPIPDEMTIEEGSEFWDGHSVADYSSRVVELEYRPEGRTTFVAIEPTVLRQVEGQARESGVSVETLINLWLQERLSAAV